MHAQWQWQNPLPQGNTLYAAQWIDQQTAWAGASAGTLIKTTDSGNSWQVVRLPIRFYVLTLFFFDAQYGWAGGQTDDGGGATVATTDGGRTWTTQLTNPFGDFQTVIFLNRSEGWAGGQSSLFRTTNGGTTWSSLPIPIGGTAIRALGFTSPFNGWAAAERLLHTTDGGLTWQRDSSFLFGRDIHFEDSLRGWLCTNSAVARTTNGGANWQLVTPVPAGWKKISVLDFDRVWVLSDDRRIAYTSNGGNSWTIRTAAATGFLNDLAFRDTLNGVVVGFAGVILKTSNAGINWRSGTQTVTSSRLSSVHFLDSQRGWISGAGGTILKTTNGGNIWAVLPAGIAASVDDIFFIDHNRGWAVASDTVFQTTNGGMTWTGQRYAAVGGWSDIEFRYFPNGLIVGGDALAGGKILKSTNGGLAWYDVNTLSLPPGGPRIQSTSSNTAWIMVGNARSGSVQVVYKSTDAGENWRSVLFGNSDTSFNSMSFVSDSVGFVSTLGYTLFKTSDGGNTWQMLQTPEIFTSLFFLSTHEGWAGSVVGEVYRTTDGGGSWQSQSSPFGSGVNAVNFSDAEHGWVVGSSGSILATTNGGTSFIDEEPNGSVRMPDFVLLQNYPNPFNPTTTIRFHARATTTELTVSIFDILGRSIRTFSIGKPQMGTNQFLWDGKDDYGKEVITGVYIYGITDGKSEQYKKMLLLR
jgi:photosystem II stability/assembly factor-like uncharacterized protein